MKILVSIFILIACQVPAIAQPPHSIVRSISLFQQEDIVVVRWVIFGGNTCQGIKVFRGENEDEIEQIGFVSGICGSTDSDETYTFVDSNAVSNVYNYYRLELGFQGFSDAVSIFFEDFGNDGIKVLPDPKNNRTRILYSNIDRNPALLRVVDINGGVQEILTSTEPEFNVNTGGWKNGLYYFQLILKDEIKSGKLFKF